MRQPKTLYVLADGGRARLVERSPDTGDFVTFEEMAGEHPPRIADTRPRSFQSGTSERHAIGREDDSRIAKEAFMTDVAERVAQVCAARGVEKVWIAAPSRLVGPLQERLARNALESIVVTRDLTKTPDSALGRWLDHLPPS
jgi:hypothetical protein